MFQNGENSKPGIMRQAGIKQNLGVNPMKKVLLTFLIIIALSWIYDVSSAKGEGAGGQENKRSEKFQKEGRAKGKAVEKDSNNIDKSKMDEGIGKGRNKDEAAGEVVGRGKEKGKAKEIVTAKGKEHQQQMKALEKRLTHEEAKHRRRVARLNRIRELAAEQGDTKTLERVDKLLQMEQQHYTRKGERMRVKDERVLQITDVNISREARKTIGTEPNKPQLKGIQQKKGKEKRDDKNTTKGTEK
jgi:biopolymer transport protein ExbB/TolQ